MPKILAFAGSTRAASCNHRLVSIAAGHARSAGGEVALISLRDFAMPLYDGDLEAREGLPPNAKELKQLLLAHDALLLACPEYNSSITGVLKNAIDWVSRPEPGEKPLAAFQGKVAALLSASPGVFGGLRGLVHVRAILSNLGVLVLPTQVTVPKADAALGADGRITDAGLDARVAKLAQELVTTTQRLRA